MHNSTPLLSMTSQSSSTSAPRPSTIAVIKQFARVYMPTLGGIVLN